MNARGPKEPAGNGSGAPDARPPRAAGRAAPGSDGDPLRDVADYLAQLCGQAAYYARAKRDSLRLGVRDAVWRLTARIATIGIGVGFVVASLVYVLDGVARGLAVALGGRVWLASLVTGLAGLLAFGVSLAAGLRYTRGAAHRRRVAEYETRKARQRDRHGRDVAAPVGNQPGTAISAGTNGHRKGGRAARPDGHRPRASQTP